MVVDADEHLEPCAVNESHATEVEQHTGPDAGHEAIAERFQPGRGGRGGRGGAVKLPDDLDELTSSLSCAAMSIWSPVSCGVGDFAVLR
jgi:hypothetical protein